MTLLLILGLLMGMRHALDADHVAAVASLVSTSNSLKSAIRQGVVWGLGHTIALFLFCSVVLLSDSVLPEKFAEGLELVVGIMLVILGADIIRRLIREKVHFHTHRHDNDITHFHAHRHSEPILHEDSAHEHEHLSGFPVRALFVGLMHGMAGSAALIVLTLQTVDSIATGLLYIIVFGVGSIMGMAILSIVIAIPLRHSAKRVTWLHNILQAVIAVVTIGFGSALIYRIGM